jgi:hypothetical protein
MRKLAGLIFAAAAMLLVSSARAQNYSIDWYTIAGGGGASSGGNFTLSGTIGQPATATMSGGNFSLTGGFWSIISLVQTPGAPLLSVVLSGKSAIISWPETTGGFLLQDSQSLTSGTWFAAPGTQVTNSGTISVTVPAASGYNFYRLQGGN